MAKLPVVDCSPTEKVLTIIMDYRSNSNSESMAGIFIVVLRLCIKTVFIKIPYSQSMMDIRLNPNSQTLLDLVTS